MPPKKFPPPGVAYPPGGGARGITKAEADALYAPIISAHVTTYRATDFNRSNNIVVAGTGLKVAALAGQVWHWDVKGIWKVSGNNCGMRITMAGPAVTWVRWAAFLVDLQSAGGQLANWDQPNVVTAFASELTLAMNAGSYQFRLAGSALLAGNGDIELEAAQKVSHADVATLEKGSDMIATRLL